MEVYIVHIGTRKHDDCSVLGPFTSLEKAQKAIKEYFRGWDSIESYTEYGSDFNKGNIYTSDYNVETNKVELN